MDRESMAGCHKKVGCYAHRQWHFPVATARTFGQSKLRAVVQAQLWHHGRGQPNGTNASDDDFSADSFAGFVPPFSFWGRTSKPVRCRDAPGQPRCSCGVFGRVWRRRCYNADTAHHAAHTNLWCKTKLAPQHRVIAQPSGHRSAVCEEVRAKVESEQFAFGSFGHPSDGGSSITGFTDQRGNPSGCSNRSIGITDVHNKSVICLRKS